MWDHWHSEMGQVNQLHPALPSAWHEPSPLNLQFNLHAINSSQPTSFHCPASTTPSPTTHRHPPFTITQHLPHTSHLDASPATHHVPHTTSFLHWLAMLRLRSVQGCRSVSYPRMSASGAAGRQPILFYHELLGASPFSQSESLRSRT
jgi:hypothetical protein